MHMSAMGHGWRCKEKVWESVLSFHYRGSGLVASTQTVRLGTGVFLAEPPHCRSHSGLTSRGAEFQQAVEPNYLGISESARYGISKVPSKLPN